MSITVSKKSIRRFLVFGSFSALLLICFSCLESNSPLSYSNNCHEARLEGTWICEMFGNNKQKPIETSTVVIRDSGSKYIVEKRVENENKTETSTLPCILTKLDSYYFISVKETDEEHWYICRIQFKDDKLLVLDLNEEGKKRAEEEDEQAYRKISQRELQQWCINNANLFTDVVYCLERDYGVEGPEE